MFPTLFPDLLVWSFLFTGIFRVLVALFHAELAWHTWQSGKRLLGGAHGVGSVLLLIGLFTQPVAILLAGLIAKDIATRENVTPEFTRFHALLFFVTLSLLFFGAGAFAFDLPL